MVRQSVTLNDKYTEQSGRIYLNGMQALVRIPLMQRQIDMANDLNTAAFISGYRGSPLGALDIEFDRAKNFTDEFNINFQPAVNEDLGATAIWGTQQLNLGPGAKYDGIIGIWYGKGPGVDRSMDAIKHANAAGSSKHGGVLALAGDDHACKSSTFPHQSEQAFIHAMVPVLNPAGIQDALDLGLHGIAMSRYSGCWSALKIITDMADSSASVFTDPMGIEFKIPEDFDIPPDGLNIRWYDPPVKQEERLLTFRLPAVKAYAYANKLDKVIFNPEKKKRLGIVTTGKAYMDTRQALEELGITQKRAEEMGIALYKIALVWPLEDRGLKEFATGFDELLVIEEKRGVIEDQIKDILYHIPEKERPLICGKTDETGSLLLPEIYELSPAQIADIIVRRIEKFEKVDDFEEKLKVMIEHFGMKAKPGEVIRMPYYCSGCPHNTSTVVPEGSRALAGIGCHYMAMWMNRDTDMFTQMGGEGVPWVGQFPFTSEKHIFINLGDGTYFHSGLLAIRQSISAKVTATYKILYNDAVAMTGGQPVDGPLSVDRIARQVEAEGAQDIYVVSNDPEKYEKGYNFPPQTIIAHRDELDRIQKKLREIKGVSILIYDQTCAAELRRRRKRGLAEDPPKRAFINERICEGCGDCGEKSNCLSITPVETEFGRKRQIDQSSCNKDFSCVKGFCPSFVTIHGGTLRKPEQRNIADDDARMDPFTNLPTPSLPNLDESVAILVTGIGGTGIVTIGALLAMAAHLEDKGCSTMDQTGLAQKGGAVTSHIRLAKRPEDIHTVRIGSGCADVVLGCDLLVTADGDAVSKMHRGKTRVFLNTHQTPTGAFTHDTEWSVPTQRMSNQIKEICGEENLRTLDATGIATALMGNSIATNMFILGYAWQNGEIPISEDAIFKAIELNNVAIGMNQKSFLWGRKAAHDLEAVLKLAFPEEEIENLAEHHKRSKSLDETINRRAESLTMYQSILYGKRYKMFIDKTRKAEFKLPTPVEDLTRGVAEGLYKLMSYKDEYEVARLYTDGGFMKQINEKFEGDFKLHFHLAPPIFSKRDPDTGELKKKEFGSWIISSFKILSKLKFLRGTPLDIFGYTEERKMERQLIKDYKELILELLKNLNEDNHKYAVEIAMLPTKLRGFGHVKAKSFEQMKEKEAKLLNKFYGREEKLKEKTEAA